MWQFSGEKLPFLAGDASTNPSQADGGPLTSPGNAPSTVPLQPSANRPNKEPTPPQMIPMYFDNQSAPSRGRLDLAKSQQREFMLPSAELGRRLDAWREEDRQWQTVVVPLLDNAAGKSLAANPAWVKGFRAIYESSRPEVSRAEAIEEIARDLTRSAEGALADANDASVPEPAASERLTALVGEARTAAESFRQGRLQIATLVGESRQQPAGTQTLRQAIAEDERVDRLAAIDAARERMEAARKAADAQITAAKEQMVRHAGEADARKILEALEADKAQREIETQRHQQEQAKKQRLAALEKDLAEIKRLLVPFVTNGYAQPGQSSDVQTVDLAPMSLSKMIGKGALQPTREGMEMLMRIACWENDRERGVFPHPSWRRRVCSDLH